MNLPPEEPTARYHFSRWGRLLQISGAYVCALSAGLFVFAIAYAIPRVDRADPWFALAVTTCVAGYMACLARLALKHRYIFDIDYRVGSRGILVEEHGQEIFVPWDHLQPAEYMPIASAFKLFVRGWPRPIFLFTFRLSGSMDAPLAEKYIRAGVAQRLRTKWIPW